MLLGKEFDKIVKILPDLSKTNKKVSAKGVNWHVDHMLKAIIIIGKTLKKSNPDAYRWEFNLSRSFVLTTNSIPRGKGKAPASALPEGEISLAEIQLQLEEARKLVAELSKLPSNSHFRHGYFGTLNLEEALKFITIHTNHHLKIIDDILTKK